MAHTAPAEDNSCSISETLRIPLRYTLQQLDEQTPSRRDGISQQQELKWRRTYCRLIRDAGSRMKISPWAIGIACLYCHRFYAVKSMKYNDVFLIATAALLLASKAEDCPKGLKNITETVIDLRCSGSPALQLRLKDPKYLDEFRDMVLVAERALLYAIGFFHNPYNHTGENEFDHPFKHVIEQMKKIDLQDLLIQTMWNLLIESHSTSIGVQHQPKHIAYAIMILVFKQFGVECKEGSWFAYFNLPPAVFTDISDQLLDLHHAAYQSKASMAAQHLQQAQLLLQQQQQQQQQHPGQMVGPDSPVHQHATPLPAHMLQPPYSIPRTS